MIVDTRKLGEGWSGPKTLLLVFYIRELSPARQPESDWCLSPSPELAQESFISPLSNRGTIFEKNE